MAFGSEALARYADNRVTARSGQFGISRAKDEQDLGGIGLRQNPSKPIRICLLSALAHPAMFGKIECQERLAKRGKQFIGHCSDRGKLPLCSRGVATRRSDQESQGFGASHHYATRRRAADRDLGLFLTLISTSLPSSSRNRISRSIEKPASFPCLRAETLG
jgi:hypothetical protein